MERNKPNIVIDRISLKKASQTLRVDAHSLIPLDYAAYLEAMDWLVEQSNHLGSFQKEIRLKNAPGTLDTISLFCADYLRECLPDLFAEPIAVPGKGHLKLSLKMPQSSLAPADQQALGEALAYLSDCFEGVDFQCLHQETKPDGFSASGNPAAGTVRKPSDKAAGQKQAVKRKCILGEAFTAKKYDPISSLGLESGRVTLLGRSLGISSVPTRQADSHVMQLLLSDQSETVTIKWMASAKDQKRAMKYLYPGAQAAVKGQVRFDARFSKENIVWADQITWLDVPVRSDGAKTKRVELHAHTKMSQDGLCDAAQLVTQAARFGHAAIAITDHSVVQAFPDAYMAAASLKKEGIPIKLIYGIEAYLANDCPYEGSDAPLGEFVVVDVETTGLDPVCDELIEIGAVRIKDGKISDSFQTFVKPSQPIPPEIVSLTGIDDAMVECAPKAKEALGLLSAFIGSGPIAAHNAAFDVSFLRNAAKPFGLRFDCGVLDSLTLSRMLLPNLQRHTLAALAKHFAVTLDGHHRANQDAEATALILLKLFGLCSANSYCGANSFCALNGIGGTKALPNHHAIVLARDRQGLHDLYTLVTASHLKYFYRRPVMPKSLLAANRNHLLLGSACEQGEVFRALLAGYDDAYVKSLCAFYDYLEIQPVANNRYLIDDTRDGRRIKGDEDLIAINRRILAFGRETDKPVVATGDVHFLYPEDECFRRILMAGQGYEGEAQPPLFLHTTSEMLEAFDHLGTEDALEVVIDAPNRIADRISESFAPFPDETFVPHEQGGEALVREIATNGAKRLYGDPLPVHIENRLEKELGSIIRHGFEVLYLAAHRLVSNSMQSGYTVGSRGSVGSSFAALSMGISEVNPLAPHYHCPQCRFSDFDNANTAAKCGPDLPDKACPVCGAALCKDGFDIPFEVFLGYEGDKVPDIDLNFSGEYQERALAYVEQMFGTQNVFRAGTVVGIQEKSAFGYAKKYLEQKQQTASRAQIECWAKGIAGVKRTTGQHPGGLIVLPMGMDIHDFTPLQRPADKEGSPTITTHFDFNSLHDRLVKLDILGHDNPTMLRRLYEFTGIDPLGVPLGDAKTLSLFTGCGALGLDEKSLGTPTGTLGIPEFGTGFVIEMLTETKPTTINELIQISGLSHGENVWLGNARDLIRSGTAPLDSCICTRDNIMNALITYGMNPRTAFNIMERVRKGNGLTAEMEADMRQNGVPAWFIDSCKKIKYMFPKAHASAYVLSALRIAYFKVHHPLAFYAAYFSVRAEEIDAFKVLGGIEAIQRHITAIDKDPDASARDNKERNHLCIAREMLLRGFEFLPPDLLLSHVNFYRIEGGKLRMPLMSVAGLGESAAQSVVLARDDRAFLSVEDLKGRTKLNSAVLGKLREIGTLCELPETAQLSFFSPVR